MSRHGDQQGPDEHLAREGSEDPMSGILEHGPTRGRRFGRFRVWAGALALAALALIGACNGDNLFSGESESGRPRVVALIPPDFVLAGDTFSVRVDAFAARNVGRIDLSVRGAVTRDTSMTFTGDNKSASAVFRIAAPNFLSDTVVFFAARATDQAGFSSALRLDTAAAFGPAGIADFIGPDSVKVGQTTTFRIRVVSARRITGIEVQGRGAMHLDSLIQVVPPRFDVTQDITLQIPSPAQDTLLRLAFRVRDESNFLGGYQSIDIPVAISPPTLALTAPVSASPGGMLDLRAVAASLRQVSQIRVQLSGAVSRDSVINITPTRVNVDQPISFRLPGDIQDSTLTVRAFAIDRSGATSPTQTAVVRIPLGAPAILSLTTIPEDSTRGGRTLDVRVVARGIRPIARIDVRFRGAVDADRSITINPERLDVTQDVSVQIPLEVADTTLTISATATDVTGAISPITTRTIRVRDVTAPTVSATVNPGQASAGKTVAIRISARDNVGISRYGFAAVTSSGDTIGITPTLAATSGLIRDSIFNFTVPAALTPQQLRIIGIAYDGHGLRGQSAPITLAVADSSAPVVDIVDPTDNSSFPLTGNMLVRARVADPSGIKRVTFEGFSIRSDSASDARIVRRYTTVNVDFPQPPAPGLPRDTTLIRFLTPVAGDNTSERVFIVVTAEDSSGNRMTDTARVTIGGPTVTLTNPPHGSEVHINGTLQITATATENAAGLDSMKVYLTGAVTDSIKVRGLNGATSHRVDTTYTLVNAPLGTITVRALAWNRNGTVGQSTTSNVTVTSSTVTDTQAPELSVSYSVPQRLEADDTIQITVNAADRGSAGVQRLGIVVVAIPDSVTGPANERVDTLYVDVPNYAPTRASVNHTFRIRLVDFLREETPGSPQRYGENSALTFPRQFILRTHAFAIDGAGNCGAAVSSTMQSLTCADTPVPPPAPIPNTFKVAQGQNGLTITLNVVGGRSVRLPGGGTIADVLVDAQRQRVYMSNMSLNRLEVFDAVADTFYRTGAAAGGRGLVGSEPWGLAFNSRAAGGVFVNDTLLVANSGGTNISFVPLGGGNDLREDVARRLLTPNTVLYQATFTLVNGLVRYTTTYFDFSDRPQFIAVDADGLVLYSTKPTGSAPDGTIRFVDTNPDGNPATTERPEVKLLFNTGAIRSVPDNFAIANIDSMTVARSVNTDDLVILYDHIPGTTTVIQSAALPMDFAISDLRSKGSDVRDFAGQWDIDRVGMSDTTFVALSTDRRVVAFGEGATAPTGRVMVCCTKAFDPTAGLLLGVSGEISVFDLINNASERVLGLGLNEDGTMGVARGSQSTYFWTANNSITNDLRLQGVFSNGVAGGAGGAAMHPNHKSSVLDPNNALSFVATANRTIKIIDTVHFYERGEIPIRDNVTGPLRVTLPFPGENAGLAANDPNYILVKLFAVTSTGVPGDPTSVVVVNVRNKDLRN